MPELPEVEYLARELERTVAGAGIIRARVFRPEVVKTPAAILEAALCGKLVRRVLRRGKYLSFDLGDGLGLWFHFGMTGRLLWESEPLAPDPHRHVVLDLSGGRVLSFRDPRRFGSVFLTQKIESVTPPGFRRLGPEPQLLTAQAFASRFKQTKARIKSALLNQRLLAGLGNIYADECLHGAHLHPGRRAYRLSRQKLARLHEAILKILAEAVTRGGSTIDDYRHADGSRGSYQEGHRVYGREGSACLTCGAVIRRIQITGRSTYFCPNCQRG